MLTRRVVLRGLALSALAVGTVGLPGGCGEDRPELKGLTLASSDVERAEPDASAIAAGVSSMQTLGSGLWGRLSGETGNLAISPFSVAVALGMTLNGARGTTLDEMLAVLGVDDVETVNAGYNSVAQHVESLAGEIEDDKEILLATGNGLFAQDGMECEQPFLDELAASYGAGVQLVDFTGAEEAREAINDWVAYETKDKITALFAPRSLDPATRLVLVNALYLKAPWDEEFEKDLTEDGDFHLEDGTVVSVPMMRGSFGSTCATGDGWTAAQVPYIGRTLAMTVVLPDEGRLADVGALLADGGMDLLTRAGEHSDIALTMPRWTFRTQSPLGQILAAMGMPTAFSDSADLSGMTREERLAVMAVQHEVFVKVDEEGTEAAAATGVTTGPTSAPTVVPLVLDRPFFFLIHDTEHGTPLFVGRVSNPLEES